MAVYEFEILNPKKSNITYIKDRQTLLIKIKTHPYKYYLEVRDKNMENELTKDLISIIHYYSMRIYTNRRKKFKEIKKFTIYIVVF